MVTLYICFSNFRPLQYSDKINETSENLNLLYSLQIRVNYPCLLEIPRSLFVINLAMLCS